MVYWWVGNWGKKLGTEKVKFFKSSRHIHVQFWQKKFPGGLSTTNPPPLISDIYLQMILHGQTNPGNCLQSLLIFPAIFGLIPCLCLQYCLQALLIWTWLNAPSFSLDLLPRGTEISSPTQKTIKNNQSSKSIFSTSPFFFNWKKLCNWSH